MTARCRIHGCCNPANRSGLCAICEDAEVQRLRGWTFADDETPHVVLPQEQVNDTEPQIGGLVLEQWYWQDNKLHQVWGFAPSEEQS